MASEAWWSPPEPNLFRRRDFVPPKGLCSAEGTLFRRRDFVPPKGLCSAEGTLFRRRDFVPPKGLCSAEGTLFRRRDFVPPKGLCSAEGTLFRRRDFVPLQHVPRFWLTSGLLPYSYSCPYSNLARPTRKTWESSRLSHALPVPVGGVAPPAVARKLVSGRPDVSAPLAAVLPCGDLYRLVHDSCMAA